MMKISYEYQGHKCPFKARVWSSDIYAAKLQTVMVIIEGVTYPFKTLDDDGAIRNHKNCEPIVEPTIKPWTAEKVPSGVEIYHPSWAKGMRASVMAVSSAGAQLFSPEYEDLQFYSFQSLVDAGWKIYGTDEPCGEVVE